MTVTKLQMRLTQYSRREAPGAGSRPISPELDWEEL